MGDHANPLGHTDQFRSPARQAASDQLLPALVRVALGEERELQVRVDLDMDRATVARAEELAYSAAWFHDVQGRWVPGSGEDRRRLVHRLTRTVTHVDEGGFEVVLRHRPDPWPGQHSSVR